MTNSAPDPSSGTRRRLKLLAISSVVAVMLWLASSAFVAWAFTQRSRPPYPEPPPLLAAATVEPLRMDTTDGQQIGAWLARGEPSKGCVILLHGNGGSRQDTVPVMRRLAEERFTVLALTFRAHGDSTGNVNDLGWSGREDVVAGVRLLQRECPGRRIYIVGDSLGAAAAIFAASELKHDVSGYFLEEPYKDLSSAVWNRARNHLPPVLDYVAYLGLRLWGPVFLGTDPDRISPLEHIAEIPDDVPVVLLAGAADRNARLEDVAALYSRVQMHARLVVFEHARHEGLDGNDPALFWSSLHELLEGAPERK